MQVSLLEKTIVKFFSFEFYFQIFSCVNFIHSNKLLKTSGNVCICTVHIINGIVTHTDTLFAQLLAVCDYFLSLE